MPTSLKLEPVMRDSSLNPSLFGSFIEHLVKYKIGITKFDEAQQLLSLHGLEEVPSHLKFTGDVHPVDMRIKWIHNSYKQPKKSITDICNLSFSHAMLLGDFNEQEASKLFTYVKENQEYFQGYFDRLQLPYPEADEQETCDKISVGCVIGVIDMIVDGSIVDIKCCQADDIEMYRKQLFAYACLHYLRYGKVIHRCEIYNFFTGKHFLMHLGDSCENHAKTFIRDLGSYCQEHLNLFVNKETL
jgi:hypothetical protein